MFVAFKWLKTSIDKLEWKFNSIWTSILHEIDVDLTSMCWKNILHTKEIIILEIRVCLANEIRS